MGGRRDARAMRCQAIMIFLHRLTNTSTYAESARLWRGLLCDLRLGLGCRSAGRYFWDRKS